MDALVSSGHAVQWWWVINALVQVVMVITIFRIMRREESDVSAASVFKMHEDVKEVDATIAG